jgi:hypothetical protein
MQGDSQPIPPGFPNENGPSMGDAGAVIFIGMLWGHSHPVVDSKAPPITFVPITVSQFASTSVQIGTAPERHMERHQTV